MHRFMTSIIAVLPVLSLAHGCQPSGTGAELPYNPQNEAQDFWPLNDNGWQYKWNSYGQETAHPTRMARYDEAHRIVKKAVRPKGKFTDSSYHIGAWYIMTYPDLPPPDDEIEDWVPYLDQVYLVDMQAKRFISRNDWNAVRPFYSMMLKIILDDDPGIREAHIDLMASVTSIIAFGHESISDPKLKVDPDDPHAALLWFYFMSEERLAGTNIHCVLKITEHSIDFKTYELEFDEPFNPFDGLPE